MKITETALKGCFCIKPKVYEDHRGCFFESFNQLKLEEALNQSLEFVQDNQAYSKFGALRGLHFQEGKYAQSKLVRVVQGSVLDVVVDLRKNSDTFGKHISVELTSKNYKQLFIPRGFAHGYITLSESAIFSYKCDNYYHPNAENGIIYNDLDLNIDWQLPKEKFLLSEKDLKLPSFKLITPYEI